MRKLILVASVLIVTLLASYLYYSGKEYELHFTERELQEQLSKGLPLTKRYLLIFEVTLDSPRVSLRDNENRIRAGLDITLNIHIGSEPLPIDGRIDASGTIRYENTSGEFYLSDPAIEDLTVQGVPDHYTDQVNKLLEKVLTEFYSERPIYRLDSEKMTQAATKMVLRSVEVSDEELVVTIGI